MHGFVSGQKLRGVIKISVLAALVAFMLGGPVPIGRCTPNQISSKTSKEGMGGEEYGKFNTGTKRANTNLKKLMTLGEPGFITLAEALATIRDSKVALTIPPGVVKVSVNTIIPANVHLRILNGGVLEVADRGILTINCTLEAGPYQIFSLKGTGRVAIGTGTVQELLIRWWGAKGDGVTNDTAAVQAAINAFENAISGVLAGTPNDNYLVDTIVFNAKSGPTIQRLLGNGAKFKQLKANNVLNVASTRSRLIIEQWHFQGNKIRNGAAIYCGKNTGNILIRDCAISGFGKGVHFVYSLYNHISDCMIDYVDYAIYLEPDGNNHSNFNLFSNIRIGRVFNTAIYLQDANVIKIDHCSIEYLYKNILNIRGCNNVTIDNLYSETIGVNKDPTFPYVFIFNNSTNIELKNSYIGLGGGTGSGSHSFNAIFLFKSCKSVTIERNHIYWKNGDNICGLYSTDGNVSSLVIRDNLLGGSGPWTIDAHPLADCINNTFNNGGWVNLPVSMVKPKIMKGNKEYSTIKNILVNRINNVNSHNSNWSLDTKAGYDDKKSLKITWNGSEANISFNNVFSTAAVKRTGVMSFFYKSDTNHKINLEIINAAILQNLPVSNDGVWRFCAAVTPPNTFANSVHGFKVATNTANGNLWLDAISMRWFDSLAEAMDWIGSFDFSTSNNNTP